MRVMSAKLQRADNGLKLTGDFSGGNVGGKCDGCADVHGDFAEAGQAAVFFFHLPHTVEAHGDDG